MIVRTQPDGDPEEQGMRSAWFDRAEVQRMIAEGAIRDAKSIAAFALLLVRNR